MLKLEDIRVTRGAFELSASIDLHEKGIVAVMGPSGGGKSTFLDVITGFLTPDTGRVLHDGADITTLPPGERPVAILFQDNNLFPHLTALQNVVLALSVARNPDDMSLIRAKSALQQVGLSGFEDRRPADLSGGQQSRVALARTILSDRPIICMDEPFSALGPALRREMLDLSREHLGDRLVLMVTHDPDDAKRIAEHTVLVADGAVHAPQETQVLFANPPEMLRNYLG